MKFLARGLCALIFITVFQTQLFAEYLYKDEVIHNPKFTHDVESLGSDLYAKTGVSLKLLMIQKLPDKTTMYDYEKNILKETSTPTILLTFAKENREIDIEANDKSLYKFFDKKQVLSPVTSYVQAFVMAATYAKSWDEFKSMLTNVGGTILPLLGIRSKKQGQKTSKYSAAMFNGYLDIAQQVAKAKGVELANGMSSNANQTSLFYVKLLFYGFVLYATIMYIRRYIYKKRHKDEQFNKEW